MSKLMSDCEAFMHTRAGVSEKEMKMKESVRDCRFCLVNSCVALLFLFKSKKDPFA